MSQFPDLPNWKWLFMSWTYVAAGLQQRKWRKKVTQIIELEKNFIRWRKLEWFDFLFPSQRLTRFWSGFIFEISFLVHLIPFMIIDWHYCHVIRGRGRTVIGSLLLKTHGFQIKLPSSTLYALFYHRHLYESVHSVTHLCALKFLTSHHCSVSLTHAVSSVQCYAVHWFLQLSCKWK